MRKINFKVPIYGWDVTVATIYDKNDEEPYRQLLKDIDAEPTAAEESIAAVRRGAVNGGDTWRDNGFKQAIIVIFPWTDKATFVDILNHEKRHLVDRILMWASIKDLEAAAFLDGWISKYIYEHLNELI